LSSAASSAVHMAASMAIGLGGVGKLGEDELAAMAAGTRPSRSNRRTPSTGLSATGSSSVLSSESGRSRLENAIPLLPGDEMTESSIVSSDGSGTGISSQRTGSSSTPGGGKQRRERSSRQGPGPSQGYRGHPGYPPHGYDYGRPRYADEGYYPPQSRYPPYGYDYRGDDGYGGYRPGPSERYDAPRGPRYDTRMPPPPPPVHMSASSLPQPQQLYASYSSRGGDRYPPGYPSGPRFGESHGAAASSGYPTATGSSSLDTSLDPRAPLFNPDPPSRYGYDHRDPRIHSGDDVRRTTSAPATMPMAFPPAFQPLPEMTVSQVVTQRPMAPIQPPTVSSLSAPGSSTSLASLTGSLPDRHGDGGYEERLIAGVLHSDSEVASVQSGNAHSPANTAGVGSTASAPAVASAISSPSPSAGPEDFSQLKTMYAMIQQQQMQLLALQQQLLAATLSGSGASPSTGTPSVNPAMLAALSSMLPPVGSAPTAGAPSVQLPSFPGLNSFPQPPGPPQ
jgi:hypothetical protein